MTGFAEAAAKAAACPTCNILPFTMHPSKLYVKFLIFTVQRKGPYRFTRNKKTYPYIPLS
jgi:hypothetical protein